MKGTSGGWGEAIFQVKKPNLQRPRGGNEAGIIARAKGRTWARNTMAQDVGGGEKEEQGVLKDTGFYSKNNGAPLGGFS